MPKPSIKPGDENVIRKNLFTWTPAEKALMEAAKMRREALKLLADANKERP